MIVYGFIILLVAGLCQGSFGLGYKKYSPFSWAAFWGIYNIMCIITSVCFTWYVAPRLWSIIGEKGINFFLLPAFCGALWGLSAVCFSKGITKIGMSMVYGISMGISTIVGSIMPMVINHTFPSGIKSAFFFTGLILTLIGVIIITIAGVKRDGGSVSSLSGVILAVISGLGSGAMNIGFTLSDSISENFTRLGYSQTALSCAKWLPVLVGGCLMGLLWCIFELFAKHEWNTITEKGSTRRCAVLFGVSIIWYAALILYGISSAMLGNMGSTAGWILFNALALIISVVWGLKTGEWKNHKKNLLFTGCAVLIAAWVFTALV